VSNFAALINRLILIMRVFCRFNKLIRLTTESIVFKIQDVVIKSRLSWES
jgi:hypothetical protein